MKRAILMALGAIAVIVLAVTLLRRGPESAVQSDPEFVQAGQFLSDSLGVGFLLPESSGWSFRREPTVPSGPYVSALHEPGKATVRLYVWPRESVPRIADVVRRRRDQLAGFFNVKDLDDVIETVMKEEVQELKGYPVRQWQAVSEVVAMAGDPPSRVMFMSVTVERHEDILELLGLLAYPVDQAPEARAVTDALLNDLTFVMQSFQFR
ncbi:MAG: hypothetical protein ACE5G2_04955 [Candidatus Krumholzibacteriia bacterium]